MTDDIGDIIRRLDRIEQLLTDQRTVKEWYTTAELADMVGKSDYTCREWCRQGRVLARKRACGRGAAAEWVISHEEILRLRNEGLRPAARSSV